MSQPVAAIKQKSKDHRHRKNPRSAELAAEARHKTNAARGKQVWVPSTISQMNLTIQQIADLPDEIILANIPAHWERRAV